jgi:hypothetical protein
VENFDGFATQAKPATNARFSFHQVFAAARDSAGCGGRIDPINEMFRSSKDKPMFTRFRIALMACGLFLLPWSICAQQHPVRDFVRDYFKLVPRQFSPDDPWIMGHILRTEVGFGGCFFNCDDEECKRYSPYIRWNQQNVDCPNPRLVQDSLLQQLYEVRQRVRWGSCADCEATPVKHHGHRPASGCACHGLTASQQPATPAEPTKTMVAETSMEATRRPGLFDQPATTQGLTTPLSQVALNQTLSAAGKTRDLPPVDAASDQKHEPSRGFLVQLLSPVSFRPGSTQARTTRPLPNTAATVAAADTTTDAAAEESPRQVQQPRETNSADSEFRMLRR